MPRGCIAARPLSALVLFLALSVSLPLVLMDAAPARAGGVSIGAGAGYKRMLVEINALFTARTGVGVEESYGHMGHMTAQAKEGVRMDVLFGDLDFLKGVPGLGVERYFDVGRGKLVLAYATGVKLAQPRELLDKAVERVGIPDAKNAIYGKAGMEYLTRSGLLEGVKPKLIEVATVPQVTAYLVSGEVQAGFVNVTDALGVRDKIGGFLELDQKLYEPIRIVGAVLARTPANPDLARYLEFLGTPEVRAILDKYGL